MPSVTADQAASCMSAIFLSKAVLELLSSRVEHQGVQPACRKVETHTGKQSFKCGYAARRVRIVPNDLKTIILGTSRQRPRHL